MKAWLKWGKKAPELRIIGDGPLCKKLEYLAITNPKLPIEFLGQKPRQEVYEQIAYARLLILPSECFETFGMVVIEAIAHGTPVAVSNIGPLPTIVKDGVNGLIFEPANPESLKEVVKTAWNTPGLLEKLSYGARRSFEDNYTVDKNYLMLLKIYEQAIEFNYANSMRACSLS